LWATLQWGHEAVFFLTEEFVQSYGRRKVFILTHNFVCQLLDFIAGKKCFVPNLFVASMQD
jgi:hypothetical protein